MRSSLGKRLRQIRVELYGEHGGTKVAELLGIPSRSWYNYEVGVTVPAEILLRFIELTAVNPLWLLHGQGDRFTLGPAVLPRERERECQAEPLPPGNGKIASDEDRTVLDFIQHVWEFLEGGHIHITWKLYK